MKIGFYVGEIQSPKIGGGYNFQLSVIEQLKKAKTKHEIYFYYRNELKLFEDTANIKFINLNFEYNTIIKKKKFFRKKTIKILKTLDEVMQNDKIELAYFISPNFENVEIPYVFTIWDLCHRSYGIFPELTTTGWTFEQREEHYNSILPKAAFVVIGNNVGKKQVHQYYNIDDNRIKTIPLPTSKYIFEIEEDETILTKYGLEKNKYLFYPAQFWPHKNHVRILKAMKILKDEGYNFKVIFTGSDVGNQKYIEQKITEYKLEQNVFILGFEKQSRLIALYKNAFCLTYASFLGPDNLPPIEAMGLSCPVICANNEGMREQLKDSAMFFNPIDEYDLVKQIKELFDETLRQELITKGKKLAEEYSIEHYVEKMFKIIDELEVIRECWSSEEKYIHL